MGASRSPPPPPSRFFRQTATMQMATTTTRATATATTRMPTFAFALAATKRWPPPRRLFALSGLALACCVCMSHTIFWTSGGGGGGGSSSSSYLSTSSSSSSSSFVSQARRHGAETTSSTAPASEPLDPMNYLMLEGVEQAALSSSSSSSSSSLASASASSGFRPGRTRAPSIYASLPVSADYRPTGQFASTPLPPPHLLKQQAAATASSSSPSSSSSSSSQAAATGEAPLSSSPPPPPPPIITIITVTYNPRHFIFRVARFVREQSLQAFRWVVVNDHTDDPISLKRLDILRDLSKQDRRVHVVTNTGERGGPAAMNYGLKYVSTPFVAILDDDDLWELTALEKAVLAMSWVPSAYAIGFDVINHGAKEFIWTRGFHLGDENFFFENGLVQGSPMRTAVFDKCRFRPEFSGGAADWDFWMCMASHGMWGLHLPENGTWYQVNPPSFRKKRWHSLSSAENVAATHARIMAEYAPILNKDEAWPSVLPPQLDLAQVSWGPLPFANPVAPLAPKRLMILLTSLSQSPVVTEMLRYVQVLAQDGWRITVVLTHAPSGLDGDGGTTRELLQQYTHDIFVAPLVAPLNHVVRLINYLIESRRITTLVVGQSRFSYAILPSIAAHAPHVKLLDYVPTCNDGADLVARESVRMDKYLDLTLASTTQVLDCVVARGKNPAKVAISRAGDVDLCECRLISREERRQGKLALGMGPDDVLIAVAGGLGPPPAEDAVKQQQQRELGNVHAGNKDIDEDKEEDEEEDEEDDDEEEGSGANEAADVTLARKVLRALRIATARLEARERGNRVGNNSTTNDGSSLTGGSTAVTAAPRYRIYWPTTITTTTAGATPPFSSSSSSSSSSTSSWLTVPAELHIEALKLADVVLAPNAPPYFNPSTLACWGAAVLADTPALPSEPAWEWGRGPGLVAPAPARPRPGATGTTAAKGSSVAQYAGQIARAVLMMTTNDRVDSSSSTTTPASEEQLKPKLARGQVACTIQEALRRAHLKAPRSRPLQEGELDAIRDNMAQAVADESARWPALFDMRSIQQKLQYRKHRFGYGRELQRKCPERVYQNTQWIDALENARGCSGESIDEAHLRECAKEQCGSWCVANLGANYPSPYGWTLRGECWTAVVREDDGCMAHIKPAVARHRSSGNGGGNGRGGKEARTAVQ